MWEKKERKKEKPQGWAAVPQETRTQNLLNRRKFRSFSETLFCVYLGEGANLPMFNRQSYRHLHINSKCSKHKKKSERSVRTKVTIPAHTREIHSELRSPLFNVSLNFNESLPHCGIMYVHTERSVRFSFQKFVSQLRI